MNLTLKRLAYTPNGVYGVLLQDGQPFAVTLERPWLNNLPNVSCVPLGTYKAKRVKSPKFGDTFEIFNSAILQGRSALLFHWGNFTNDSRGCILVAEKFKDIDGDGVQDIAESKGTPNEGFLEFLVRTKGVNEFTLEIVDG